MWHLDFMKPSSRLDSKQLLEFLPILATVCGIYFAEVSLSNVYWTRQIVPPLSLSLSAVPAGKRQCEALLMQPTALKSLKPVPSQYPLIVLSMHTH